MESKQVREYDVVIGVIVMNQKNLTFKKLGILFISIIALIIVPVAAEEYPVMIFTSTSNESLVVGEINHPNPILGENITFSASVVYDNDPAVEIQSVGWDFGDGDSSPIPNTTHAYSDSGLYPVQFIVTTNCEEFIIPYDYPVKSNIPLNFEATIYDNYTVRLSAISNPELERYQWVIYGKEYIGKEILYPFGHAGIYTIKLESDLSTSTYSQKVPVVVTEQQLTLLSNDYDLSDYNLQNVVRQTDEGDSFDLWDFLFGWL